MCRKRVPDGRCSNWKTRRINKLKFKAWYRLITKSPTGRLTSAVALLRPRSFNHKPERCPWPPIDEFVKNPPPIAVIHRLLPQFTHFRVPWSNFSPRHQSFVQFSYKSSRPNAPRVQCAVLQGNQQSQSKATVHSRTVLIHHRGSTGPADSIEQPPAQYGRR